MKNKVKSISSHTLTFILGVLLSASGVIAATILSGTEVSYTGNKVSGASNIQQAIDNLYTTATTSDKVCATGYVKQNENGRVYECIAPASSCSGEGCKLCKRAESLHTETCNQSPYYCSYDYSLGGTITYGNQTTTSGVLNTGDAFDCDVNGDGIYDNMTERFYYVSTKNNGIDTNSNIAVLIYYNNTINGVTSTSGSKWYSSSDNSYGPELAKANLPTESQWNTRLTTTTRNITYENNIVRVSNFNYVGYAARLLTYQEVSQGCYDGTTAINLDGGLKSKCIFLMENSKYSDNSNPSHGPWLESPSSSYSNSAWRIRSDWRKVITNNTSNVDNGARPAIEVQLSEIEY